MIPVYLTVNYLEFNGKEYNCTFVRDISEPKQIEKEIREGEVVIRSLYKVANDILDLSKIDADKLELEEQAFDLQQCIEESLNLLALRGHQKNLELAYTIEEMTPLKVVGDVTRLRQILVNLLNNAITFTNAGEVTVHVQANLRDGSHDNDIYEIQFAVRDTGIGIAPEQIDRLFKSFSQVHTSIDPNYGGSGLGLAISKKLSELMGGK
ncbi:MAG: hypothetical protein F6K39_08065, partial [Okeania sp. SIO3B3]|nr:hypothetical protein [Okeania sp. SIO3B3]